MDGITLGTIWQECLIPLTLSGEESVCSFYLVLRTSDPTRLDVKQGAAFTFNLIQYRSFLESLAECVLDDRLAPEIHFPSFDHALKDPSPNPAPILARHRIILIEGLYVLYTRPGWADCATMMDIRVWIECEREVARGRIIKRHLRSGLFDDYENTAKRGECNLCVSKRRL